MVDSVCEALLLEANLIKRYQPRFNVRLKDDKSYPYIKITLGDDFPRIERTRKLPNDGSRYFGPYASASSVDEAMNLVRRLFPFRTCTIDIKDGERALAAAVPPVPHQALPGPVHRGGLEDGLPPPTSTRSSCSSRAAGGAGRRRSGARCGGVRAAGVRAGGGRAGQDPGDRADDGEPEDGGVRADRAGPRRPRPPGQPGGGPAVRDPRRQGARPRRVLARRRRATRATTRSSSASCSSTTPRRRASRARSRAALRSPDTADLEAFLAERARRPRQPAHVRSAASGGELMELATRNADRDAGARAGPLARRPGQDARRARGAGRALGLAGPPIRIECYDISNFQGRETVGSMVVFEEGRPRTGEYRRFRIRTVEGAERLREPPGGAAPPVPAGRERRGGRRGGAALGDARPRHRRRRPRPGERRQGGARRARACTTCRWPAWPRSARSWSCPDRASRCCCRRPRRRCIWCSACATRRTGSRSPITATCARSAQTRSAFDDMPGVGPARTGRC